MTEVAARGLCSPGSGFIPGQRVFSIDIFHLRRYGNADDPSAAHQEFGKRWCGWIDCVGRIFVDAGSGIGKAISSSYKRGKISERGLSSMESRLGNRSTERGNWTAFFPSGRWRRHLRA